MTPTTFQLPNPSDVAAIPDDQLREALHCARIEMALRNALYSDLQRQFVAMENDSSVLKALARAHAAGKADLVNRALTELGAALAGAQVGRGMAAEMPARMH